MMRTKACDNCGHVNTLTRPRDAYRCKSCGCAIDWRHKVACTNCGETSIFESSEREDYICRTCGHKILWTLDPTKYLPNKLSRGAFTGTLAMTALLLLITLYATWYRRVAVPIYGGRRGMAIGHFDGLAVLAPISTIVCVISVLSLLIADHFDTRHNEYRYKQARKGLMLIAYILNFASIFFTSRIS